MTPVQSGAPLRPQKGGRLGFESGGWHSRLRHQRSHLIQTL